MRRALLLISLVVPVGWSFACSDDATTESVDVVADGGSGADVDADTQAATEPEDAGADSGPPPSWPADGGCPCNDDDDETTDTCATAPICVYAGRTALTQTELRGGRGGDVEATQMCPAGAVLVGIDARIANSGSLGLVTPVCAFVHVVDTAVPFKIDFPAATTDAGVRCDGPVIGFSGDARDLVDRFVGRCVTATAEQTAGGDLKLSFGAASDGFAVGTEGRSGAFPVTDCATGTVAVGLRARKGGSLDAIGLVCSGLAIWSESLGTF